MVLAYFEYFVADLALLAVFCVLATFWRGGAEPFQKAFFNWVFAYFDRFAADLALLAAFCPSIQHHLFNGVLAYLLWLICCRYCLADCFQASGQGFQPSGVV